MTAPSLRLHALEKSFGASQVLRGVDLDVQNGEFLTLLGPSGSGKSTVLRMVAGFTTPDVGQIFLGQQDVSRASPASRNIGMVFQNYALFPHLTAAGNIAYGLKMRGWDRRRRGARVEEMLHLVGLPGMGGRLPRQMSGGQQQRVALARALAFAPRLLLMDEPLGALDRELRVQMTGELRRLHREVGTTFLYVTHDRDEAMSLSDRVAIMRHGRIETVAPPADLFERPRTAFAASFFGGHNLVLAEWVEAHGDGTATIRCGGLLLRCPAVAAARSPVMLAVPRSAIGLTLGGGVAVPADILSMLYFGEVMELSCRTAALGLLAATIDARASGSAAIAANTTIYLDTARCMVVAA